ncbi:MAG: hypothetical protein Q4F21_13585, partial [Lachnospiraceae bacterium]|nr:hypothetical protein [Lachnospiraceae bacterium]
MGNSIEEAGKKTEGQESGAAKKRAVVIRPQNSQTKTTRGNRPAGQDGERRQGNGGGRSEGGERRYGNGG